MRLFKKQERPLTGGQENTANRIADRILKAQQQAADYLNNKTGGFSRKNWLLTLIMFSVVFGSYCLYLLISAFN